MKRLLVLTLFLLLSGPAGRALEVSDSLWGFDGHVVPDRFNLLSILISNPGAAPFEGTMELHETGGLSSRIGAEFVQQVYLAPFSSRWVQFYPYTTREPEWTLSWGKHQDEQFDLPQAKFAPPAQVEFISPSDPLAGSMKARAFPDDLFPPTVAATDGLDSVALDYAPKWEPVKREAFLDWLRRGGTLHLMFDRSGQYPQFPDDLAVLNTSLDRFPVGNGQVIRHPFGRAGADSVFSSTPAGKLNDSNNGVAIYDLDRTFLENLVSFTNPHIQWGLIITLTILYVLVIGPAHYFWGRKRNYNLVIGALLAAVAGFSWMFVGIGRRGQGEAASVQSVSWARALGGDRYDVTQWVNTFVVHGGVYNVTHPSAHNLYSADPSGLENVNAVIQNGKDGFASADIPLYSSSSLVHHAVMKGDNTGVNVVSWKSTNSKLDELILQTGEDFPKEVVKIWVRHGDLYYPMKLQDGRIVLDGAGRNEDTTFNAQAIQMALNTYQYTYVSGQQAETKTDDATAYNRFALPLMARAVGNKALSRSIAPPPPPDDHVQLFIFARSPKGFHEQSQGIGNETGYVLYQQEIVKPSS